MNWLNYTLGVQSFAPVPIGACLSRARRCFLDCRPKPLGSAGLHAGVVLNFLEEFGFGFLEKPRLTHEPAMIARAFAKTSSAGTSLVSPRS